MCVRYLSSQGILFKRTPALGSGYTYLSSQALMRLGWEHHKFKAGLGNTARPNFRKMRIPSIKWEVKLVLNNFVFDGYIYLYIVFFHFMYFDCFSLPQFLSDLLHIPTHPALGSFFLKVFCKYHH